MIRVINMIISQNEKDGVKFFKGFMGINKEVNSILTKQEDKMSKIIRKVLKDYSIKKIKINYLTNRIFIKIGWDKTVKLEDLNELQEIFDVKLEISTSNDFVQIILVFE